MTRTKKRASKTPAREESTKYTRPDGTIGTMRWTAEEQATLRRLSPDGTIKTATAMLHASLPPSLDGKGRYFTKSIRDIAASGAIPSSPHPDRPTPEEIKAEEDRLQDLRKRIALTDRHNHFLLAVISEQMRQRDAVAA